MTYEGNVESSKIDRVRHRIWRSVHGQPRRQGRATLDLTEPEFGASIDVDGEGNVLGIEFLSLKEYPEPIIRFGGIFEPPGKIEGTAYFSLPSRC